MRTIDATALAQFDSPKVAPFLLFEIYLDSGTQYLTDLDRKVLWSTNTYLPFPIEVGEIKYSLSGIIDRFSAGVSNVNRAFSALVMAEEFRGRRLIVRRAVLAANGYDILAPVEVFSGLMDEVGGNIGKRNSVVQVTATTDLAYWQTPLPKRQYQTSCEWAVKGRFKGTECGYAGAGTSCDGQWATCKGYGNQAYFGGFRHIAQLEGTEIFWGKAEPGKVPVRIYY